MDNEKANQSSKSISSNNQGQKLKILALHGYRQNAEVFRQKTGSFRKIVNKWAEFTYITAPHKVLLVHDLNDLEKGEGLDEEQYGWFFNRNDKTYRGIRKGGPALGFDDSINLIEEVCQNHGPFDGILGFSQGACFVGLLCWLQQIGLIKMNFHFAILASGFKSGSLPHLKYYNEKISLPSLHVFGENDGIIPTDMSEGLSQAFEDPVIVRHPGGHYLPATSAQKNEFQNFFKLMFLHKQERESEPST